MAHMDQITIIKNLVLGALASAFAVVSDHLGGWDVALQVLIGFMVADYLTGLEMCIRDSYLTWAKANDIEKILVDVDDLLTKIAGTVDLGWALGIAHIGLYGGIT